MSEVQKAAFSIERYKAKRFSFIEPPLDIEDNLSLGFQPSGKYYTQDSKFVMDLLFTASLENEESKIMDVAFETTFAFDEQLAFEDIPSYFYRNALGIIFPYLRAFVSTLTFQANMNPIVLPLLNLTTLEQVFKENTVVVSDKLS